MRRREESPVSELSEQAAACTECTGLLPAMVETEEENATRALCGVTRIKRTCKGHEG